MRETKAKNPFENFQRIFGLLTFMITDCFVHCRIHGFWIWHQPAYNKEKLYSDFPGIRKAKGFIGDPFHKLRAVI